ncbi:hypothetical protein OS176_11495 [Xanthomonadaceae bacterium XH05]|nr:hypothetical protein [Xanthomonadaceae bacterium XH05]
MRRILVPFLTCILFVTPCAAQEFSEVDRVEYRDFVPTGNGRLGRHLAVAGHQLLATAPQASSAPYAYAFDWHANGTLGTPQGLQPTIAPISSVITGLDADGDWAALGEYNRVRLFRRTGAQWNNVQLLTLNNVNPTPGITVRGLGSAVAMVGDLMAVGDNTAHAEVASSPVNNAGAVVLFRRTSNGQWQHEATVRAATPVASSGFGDAVALWGNTLLVGAPNSNRAYVFQRQGSTWQQAKMLADPISSIGSFGWSVALENDTAVVGCARCLVLPLPSDPTNTGAFHVFERHQGGSNQWGHAGRFYGTPSYIDEFSASLRLRDGLLLVGASGNRDGNGVGGQYASIFTRNGSGQWQERGVLASSHTNNSNYGAAVAFVGARVAVSADIFPNFNTGTRWGALHAWYSPRLARCGNFDGIFCDGFETD